MIVAVTGGRNLVVGHELAAAWTQALERNCGTRSGQLTTIRHGGCTGLDAWVDRFCRAAILNGWPIEVEVFAADWRRYERAAGPIRNRDMLRGYRGGDDPTAVHLAFNEPIAGMAGVASILFAFEGGRGTADCVAAACDYGIRVVEVRA